MILESYDKYEYKYEILSLNASAMTNKLNSLGAEGWELIWIKEDKQFTQFSNTHHEALFKRKIHVTKTN